ncbi:recombination mediator RecR [Fangia hongkongensis]|uniref:recombination mediator RecR n=1 Tax=Fangia hongkongensis TaxID=270495 RepID=UPI0003771B84|nr:recombination mediator RecR [Fangia hongkongensis]MBK2125396.1 recombination protein RecR [Fangia hongkongensis]
MQSFFSDKIINLIEALKTLPGVGKKTAQRMALQLLDKNTDGARRIAMSIDEALQAISNCDRCHMLTDKKICDLCSGERGKSLEICVVENMLDLLAIENAAIYQGRYFVLNGRISPLDGVGPEELYLPKLEKIVEDAQISEVVLALSPSVEGETTAHYISEMLSNHGCKISKIGFGVPFGGELEYLDQQTLLHAFSARVNF